MTFKKSSNDDFWLDIDRAFSGLVQVFIGLAFLGIFIGGPIGLLMGVENARRITNEQCGYSYTFFEYLTSAKEIQELCRIKQQKLEVQVNPNSR